MCPTAPPIGTPNDIKQGDLDIAPEQAPNSDRITEYTLEEYLAHDSKQRLDAPHQAPSLRKAI